MSRREDLSGAVHQIHTPESFGRALLDAAVRSALDRDEPEMVATVKVSEAGPDGTVPVCFYLFSYEICVNIPIA